jgi:acyl-coenzyme A thioesterase PaaI-like protein
VSEHDINPYKPPHAAGDADAIGAHFEQMHNAEVTPRRAEMRRLGNNVRRIIERLMATKAPEEDLKVAADTLEYVATILDQYPQGRLYEFAESAVSADPHAFFDHSPVMGLANPLAAPLRLEVRDGVVHGQVHFGSAYEGPPGSVHGGYVACAFDEVLGLAQAVGGSPGMTGTLTIKYRRPTPLHTDLRFEARLERSEGRKLFCTGELHAPDGLCAEAEGIFISVDMTKIAELMEKRKAGGAGA